MSKRLAVIGFYTLVVIVIFAVLGGYMTKLKETDDGTGGNLKKYDWTLYFNGMQASIIAVLLFLFLHDSRAGAGIALLSGIIGMLFTSIISGQHLEDDNYAYKATLGMSLIMAVMTLGMGGYFAFNAVTSQ